MKIAVFHQMGSGGSKRALYEHVVRLVREHEVDLYVIDAFKNEQYLDLRPLVRHVRNYPLELPVWTRWPLIKTARPFAELHSLSQLSRRIAADIDGGGYDIVYVHASEVTNAPELLSQLSTRSVYYCHEPRRRAFEYEFRYEAVPGRGLAGLYRRGKQALIERRINATDLAATRSASQVLCNSYYSMEAIIRAYGIEPLVCYLGVDVERFPPKAAKATSQVLVVGAMHFNKQHDFVVRALGQLPVEIRPTLTIVYNRELPGYREQLQRLAGHFKVKLNLLREVSDERLAEEYAKSAMLVAAARLEPFGFTPLEAMAAGRPTVAIRQGGYRETVQEPVTGFLLDRDEAKFAEAISAILTGSVEFDAAKLRHFAQRNWSWESSCDQLVKVLTNTKVTTQ